jgi:DNA repair exonuclease SbcCD ATPase subunit
MLVRSVSLRNVRSFNDDEEARVEIPEGIVLFEGDIGSGKSTLLYAIEFALFGLSDMKGAYLLSEGRREGRVSVVIEAGGIEYTIERKLRAKNDEVSQDECSISSGGSKERLSPSDLKERVVSILGFNEPTHPRAESLVYRYAVFTPQEQMKSILTQNADDRLHVVRRVLGTQSYQVAVENSAVVERRIGKMSYGLQKASDDLAEKRKELGEMSDALEHLRRKIPSLESEAKAAEMTVREIEHRWKDHLRKREALSKAVGSIEPLEESIADLEARISDHKKTKGTLESSLSSDVLPVIDRFDSATRPGFTVKALTSKSNTLRRKLASLETSMETTRSEVSNDRELISKGVCPTCRQTLPADFSRRTEHIEEELKKMENEMLTLERETLAVEADLASGREYEELGKESARATRERSRMEEEIQSLAKKIGDAESRLGVQKAELANASALAEELDALSGKIDKAEEELTRARAAEKRSGDKLTRAQDEVADGEASIGRLSVEVEKKEKDAAHARKLSNYEEWLGAFFRPTVGQIERQALSQAAARFNEHFQRFFTTLVDDPDMVVKVREDFSPVFEREGFDQDFEALSGGERTSMALAYRFALNAVVRDNLENQPDLIVLDEPTDGFSKEQVYKMRELLEELDSRQVILVSHERELESMADHIFRVTKTNGTSRVSKS